MDLARSIGALSFRFARRCSRFFRPNEPDHHWLGRYGEKLAAQYLKRRGYRILYCNFRAPQGGEVDIVCRDKVHNILVFIEVKTRSSRDFVRPATAVTSEKEALIIRGALHWLRLLNRRDVTYRFDIIEVIANERERVISHIEHAFQMPENSRR